MKRTEYLTEVIRLYLCAPGTPAKARRRDWAIATTFYQRRIPLRTVAHAIRLAALRRQLRDSRYGPLEPIHSLAYYRTVIDQMDPVALDPSYVDYVAWRYKIQFAGQPVQSAAKEPEYGGF